MATTTKKTSKKSKNPNIVERGKRKQSIARATIKAGNGNVRINSQNLEAISNRYVKEMIREPLNIAKEITPKVDISVSVRGGGEIGQAQAARTAVARALVKYADDATLKEKMNQRDRFMIAEDSRRIEPKKYKGPKARARFQKSYR